MFKDSSWFFKVLTGGICLTLAWTIIGVAAFLGYHVHTVNAILQDEENNLPEWKKLPRLLADGFAFLLLLLSYLIPIALIVRIVFHLSLGWSVLALAVAWFLFLPVASMQYVKTMSLQGCFTLESVLPAFRQSQSAYLAAVGVSCLTIVLTVAFGWMSLIIGWPLVVFWGTLVQAHITAQFIRSTGKKMSNGK